MRRLILIVGLLVGLLAAPAAGAKAPATSYTYHQDGTAITVTYTCDDGSIIPGPHPLAIIGSTKGHGSQWTVSAHGVEKLDALMQANFGLSLTSEAKTFLYALLPTITC